MSRKQMTQAALKRSPFTGGPRFGGPQGGRKAKPMQPMKGKKVRGIPGARYLSGMKRGS